MGIERGYYVGEVGCEAPDGVARIAEQWWLDWMQMELFDWYWLGVSAGLGVAAGTAAAWIQSAGPRVLGAIAFAIAALVGIFVAFFVAGWGPAVWAGAATVAWIALRRLVRAAFPAAFLAFALLAFIPLVGYLEAVTAPLVGGRLRRRADEKYAGLRVLAKD